MSKALVLLVTAIFICGPAVAALPATEEDAVRQIYNQLDGEHWVDASRWLIGDPCSWHGVECFDGHVSKIRLPENRVRGNFGALDKFQALGHLGQLELWNTLDTEPERRNMLTGTMPPGFGTLLNLYYIDLRFNQIADGLTAFVPLSKLQTLALEENRFAGEIPSEIGGLRALTLLTLNGNQLSGEIPSRLGELTGLTKLWLYNNALDSEIPSSLGALRGLTELRLGGNLLHGSIPASLGDLTQLTILELGLAKLSGPLPETLGNLQSLQILSLGTNRLSGSLDTVAWGGLGALREVYLDRNLFTGQLPAALADLTGLSIVRLRGNGFDHVPSSYAALASRATDLDLRWNALDPSESIAAALDSASHGEFSATQTRAPRDVNATFTFAPGQGGNANVQLYVTWLPIPFVAGEGGYRIAAQYVHLGQTFELPSTFVPGKERGSSSVAFPSPVATPSPADSVLVRVSTLSGPHPFNDGQVESKLSPAVTAVLGSGEGVAVFERERIATREGDVLVAGVLRAHGNTGGLRSNTSATTSTASWGDFTLPKPSRLVWAEGEVTPKSVRLSTVADNRREGTETFVLKLDSPAATATAIVEIGDQTVAGDATDPLVATNGDGLSFAVWTERQPRSTLRNVLGRFLDPSGRPTGTFVDVATDPLLDEYDPVVVAMEDDSFLVGWIEEPGDGSDKRIGLCRMRAREKHCSRYIEPLSGYPVAGLALAAAGDDGWLGWITGTEFLAVRVSPSGLPGSPIVVARAGVDRRLSEPQLIGLDVATIVAAWTSTRVAVSGQQPSDGGEIQFQSFSSSGPLPSQMASLGEPTALARKPRLSRIDTQTALLAWVEVDKGRRRGEQQVAWTEVSTTGTATLPPLRVPVPGYSVVQLAVVRESTRCQLVWLAASATTQRLERWLLAGCRASAAASAATLPLSLAEGVDESFAASASPSELIVVEQLVAGRGVRWLRNLRPPIP